VFRELCGINNLVLDHLIHPKLVRIAVMG